ncbi:MAG TPA: type II CAAX endopeptidase family protein [Mucilaginibacter sp.]|nr:type II CAAX endopeptidase family protein [Mucilaginibacter sp.]
MLFLVFVLISLIIGVVVVILLISITRVNLNSPILKSALNLVLYIITNSLIINYALRKSKKRQGYFSKVNFNKIQLWLVPTLIVGTLALIIPLAQVGDWIPMPKAVQKFFENAFRKDVFSIITMVIAAPIMEEILCRGIVLKGLLKNYQPQKAILISAVFFGALHLNPWQAIPAFFGGLFLGWAYYKTQSVIPGMIIHATINGTAALILFLPHNKQNLITLWGLPYYLIALLLSILVFTSICILIQRKTQINSETLI